MSTVSGAADAANEDNGKDQAKQREAFIAEALRIEIRHQSWADAQHLQGAWWRRWNTLITVVAATLAAASGGAGLASETFRTLAGIAALAAAGLAAMASAFGTSSRSVEAFESATRNQVLADFARAFRVTTAPFAPLADVRKKFDELIELRNETAPKSQLRLGVHALRAFRKAADGQVATPAARQAGSGG